MQYYETVTDSLQCKEVLRILHYKTELPPKQTRSSQMNRNCSTINSKIIAKRIIGSLPGKDHQFSLQSSHCISTTPHTYNLNVTEFFRCWKVFSIFTISFRLLWYQPPPAQKVLLYCSPHRIDIWRERNTPSVYNWLVINEYI